MTSFRFIHTADIHLDSPLKGLAGHEGSVAQRIRSASREAFDQLIGHAIEEDVAFVVIAGDLYDGDWRDYQTGLYFVRQMGRLADAGIDAFVIHGNHDAQSQITRRLSLPDNVKIFSTRKPETLRHGQLEVALHGQSYRQRDIVDDLVPAYPEPVVGAFNIGVLHTGLGGLAGHANYAPCTEEELVAKGYDYWALGHVHEHRVLHEREGQPHIVFPGNLQGRHINEAGPRSACLVTVEDGDITDFSLLEIDDVRWARVDVALTEADTSAVVPDRIREAIQQAVERDAAGRLLACRVEVTGRAAAHDHLVTGPDNLLAEARAAALGLGDEVAWVERVVVSTQPVVDPVALRTREDALGDLSRLLDGAALDVELVGQIESDIGQLIRKLPAEIRSEIEDPDLAAAADGDYAGLVKQVQVYLMSRLTADER